MRSLISEIFIVTNESQKFFVIGQIVELELSLPGNNLLIEPEGKNTLPAICFGINEVEKIFGVCDVGIFSSDHIMDVEAMDTIAAAKDLANEYLVLFGIVPKSPNTGYGYIKPGEAVGAGYRVSEFKEKPDIEQAKKYVDNGYLWNSGMFLFNTKVFLLELSKYAPELLEAFASNKNINEIYSDISTISVDYGLLEKSDNVAVVRLDIKGSDPGNFDAMYNEFVKDEFGNVEFGCEIILKNSSGNIVQSTKEKVVSLIDVDDLVVVDTPDALLVCPGSSSQKVKEIVDVLKARNDERASFHGTVYRSRGSYTVMEDSERY